jgi:hypothetical protein
MLGTGGLATMTSRRKILFTRLLYFYTVKADGIFGQEFCEVGVVIGESGVLKT